LYTIPDPDWLGLGTALAGLLYTGTWLLYVTGPTSTKAMFGWRYMVSIKRQGQTVLP